MRKKYLIIGNSAAGIAATRTLRQLNVMAAIVAVSDEQEQAYNKCFLADYIAQDKTIEQVYTLQSKQLAELDVTMKLGKKVISIDAQSSVVHYHDHSSESYDALLLATGTRPRQISLGNIRSDDAYDNLFVFHNLYNVHHLHEYIERQKPQSAIVIGAGLSGIEVADALVKRGIQVTLIERGDQIMKGFMNAACADLLMHVMKSCKVEVQLDCIVSKVEIQATFIRSVVLNNGITVAADMVVVAAGVVQNKELAQEIGLECDRQGILVNEYMQTSHERIYAAGDLISVIDHLSGERIASCTWPDAMQQGRYAAYAMVGQPNVYKGAHIITNSSFFGLGFYHCGPRQVDRYRIIEKKSEHTYEHALLEGDLLKGFTLLGDSKRCIALKGALLAQSPCLYLFD